MKKTLFPMLAIIILSCTDSRPEKKTVNKEEKDTLTKQQPVPEKTAPVKSPQNIVLGHADSYEKLPKLTFEEITESEFSSFRQKTYRQTFKPVQQGNFFYIQTALKKHKFKKYKDYGGEESWNGYEFSGYYPASKLFAITQNSTSDNLGFGELFLLDSLSDCIYNIVSFGDGSVEPPIPSVNNKYFVYYYNAAYEHANCDIGVLKVNDTPNRKNYLREHASYHSTDFAIEKILWKSDNSFLVKGYAEVFENDQWVKKYKYYQTTFK